MNEFLIFDLSLGIIVLMFLIIANKTGDKTAELAMAKANEILIQEIVKSLRRAGFTVNTKKALNRMLEKVDIVRKTSPDNMQAVGRVELKKKRRKKYLFAYEITITKFLGKYYFKFVLLDEYSGKYAGGGRNEVA